MSAAKVAQGTTCRRGSAPKVGAWDTLPEIMLGTANAAPAPAPAAARCGGWAGKFDTPKSTVHKAVGH